MKRQLAQALRGMAARLHDEEHLEKVEVLDEYGILRCRVEVIGDGSHGVDAAFLRLPQGWDCFVLGNTHDYREDRSDTD